MAGEASERAAGSEERPQGRSARQQCREESLGLGGAKSPAHPRVQEANKPPQSSSTIRQLFFVCFWGFFVSFFFFFFFSNISKEESKGRCVFFFKEFFCCCFRRVCGLVFFLCHFFQGKRKRKAPSAKSCLCKKMGIPGAAGAPSTQARVQVPASLPTSHPRRKESQQAYPRQRSFG